MSAGSNNLGVGTSFKGVFLDQAAEPGQPYYSVRARTDTTIDGIKWNFLNWSSSNVDIVSPNDVSAGYRVTPIIFRSGASRTVTTAAT